MIARVAADKFVGLAVAASLLCAPLAAAGSTGAGEPGADAKERIFVLSQDGAALTEIAPDSGDTLGQIALPKAPAAIALAPDTPRAYVTHSEQGKVSVVDLAAGSVVRTIPVAGSPFGIAVAKNGRLYVADWNESRVTVVDAEGGDDARTVQAGHAPAHVVLTPDEQLLFVANREGNSVSAVRTGDLSLAATIPVGRAPFAMTLSPDARRLYVGNVQASSVSVIDTQALTVVETVQSGAMPYGAAVTPDGARLLVTHQSGGNLGVFEGGKAAGRIRVGSYPEGVAITADGARAFVANWFADSVSVVDLEGLREERRIKCPGGPRAVVIWRP